MNKSNKEISFGAMVDAGLSKEEIMQRRGIKESKEYDRIYASLMKIREQAAQGDLLPSRQRRRRRR